MLRELGTTTTNAKTHGDVGFSVLRQISLALPMSDSMRMAFWIVMEPPFLLARPHR